jgi:hypothetical protein
MRVHDEAAGVIETHEEAVEFQGPPSNRVYLRLGVVNEKIDSQLKIRLEQARINSCKPRMRSHFSNNHVNLVRVS